MNNTHKFDAMRHMTLWICLNICKHPDNIKKHQNQQKEKCAESCSYHSIRSGRMTEICTKTMTTRFQSMQKSKSLEKWILKGGCRCLDQERPSLLKEVGKWSGVGLHKKNYKGKMQVDTPAQLAREQRHASTWKSDEILQKTFATQRSVPLNHTSEALCNLSMLLNKNRRFTLDSNHG